MSESAHRQSHQGWPSSALMQCSARAVLSSCPLAAQEAPGCGCCCWVRWVVGCVEPPVEHCRGVCRTEARQRAVSASGVGPPRTKHVQPAQSRPACAALLQLCQQGAAWLWPGLTQGQCMGMLLGVVGLHAAVAPPRPLFAAPGLAWRTSRRCGGACGTGWRGAGAA